METTPGINPAFHPREPGRLAARRVNISEGLPVYGEARGFLTRSVGPGRLRVPLCCQGDRNFEGLNG